MRIDRIAYSMAHLEAEAKRERTEKAFQERLRKYKENVNEYKERII